MKGNCKKAALISVILIAIVAGLLVANRYFYGSFNIFSHPVRIVYGGFHYNHRSLRTLSTEEKPMAEVSRIFDIITGKRIFSMSKNYIGPGKTIYLHLEGNNYISYSSGGGG
jgi:hypothetical protein